MTSSEPLEQITSCPTLYCLQWEAEWPELTVSFPEGRPGGRCMTIRTSEKGMMRVKKEHNPGASPFSCGRKRVSLQE
jgi:hypothetical protein